MVLFGIDNTIRYIWNRAAMLQHRKCSNAEKNWMPTRHTWRNVWPCTTL